MTSDHSIHFQRPNKVTRGTWNPVCVWMTDLISANIQARLWLTLVTVASDVVFSLRGPECLFPPGRKTLPNFIPPPLLSDITLASHIHNRPWKHPGNTDTLGLSIMRRTGPSGWIPSSVQFPNLHTHTNMPSNSRSWPPCTLHSLNSLPGDKKKKNIHLPPIQVTQ